MGEGKTRVILPMLVLHLARTDAPLVRLHFLSQLIGEAYDYLHRHITASLMCRRLCLFPFHRDVKLQFADVLTMHECLQRCQATGGAVCVAPEHRLSLQLKWHELRSSAADVGAVCAALKELEAQPFFDILDESDEILRYKYQLIYAVGACKALPAGSDRWIAAQAVLKWLHEDGKVRQTLKIADIATRVCKRSSKGAGSFDEIRLLVGPALDAQRAGLRSRLAAAVFRKPPYEMRWLSDRSDALKSKFLKFVTDPESSLDWLKNSGVGTISEIQEAQLLALRGFLAYGLLERCLARRHRVDFGIDRRRGTTGRVAVPFRASDTPAERAEYAQPDTLILFTLLSYYGDGLARSEIREAAAKLLLLGPEAQRAEYALWVESGRSTMSALQLEALDKVEKLDLSSVIQLGLLWDTFRYNMAAINFWLNHCVFPTETMQFPHRLVTNAYNLTDNAKGAVVGFSGTKDSYLLLPVHVAQRTPDGTTELCATDGKMLDLVLNYQVVLLDSQVGCQWVVDRSMCRLVRVPCL